MKLLLAILFLASVPAHAESIRFYSGIDMHYCSPDRASCYTSSFGYQWWEVPLTLVDSSYLYWTGTAEQTREYRGHTYVGRVFIEEWRGTPTNRVTLDILDSAKPAESSHLQFWVKDLHDFVHFELSGPEVATPEGSQNAILSFGPEYVTPR